MPTVHEQLSEQFRRWELRGRGWQVFDEPVSPEPPFRPFFGHYLPDTPIADDGRKPTFLSSFVDKLSRKLSTTPSEPAAPPTEEQEPEPHTLIREPLVELQTSLPAKLDIGKDAFDQFLRNLSFCREPVAFEMLGTPGRVNVQFAAHPNDAPIVRRQLQAYFPEATFQPREGALSAAWETCEGKEILVAEFGLAREFMFPLECGALDPFIGIVGAFSELEPGELALFQVLFESVEQDWPESIVRSVTHEDGKPFFVNMPELAAAAEHKVARPLYAAVVRIAVKSESFEGALRIARDMAGSLRVFADPQGNELIPLDNETYPFNDHVEDVLRRQSRRSGMILNSDELIGFVHLPGSAVRSSALERDTARTKAVPGSVRNATGLLLGNNVHLGETIPVRLTTEQRVRHTHVIGATGTGKSTLLFNLIRQDIENGQGVGVLDPSGDLIDRILGIIPDSRVNDVILVNPSDTDFSIGFNILSAHSDVEKTLLASDLVSMFRRLSASWGDQMDMVLRNAILAFLESSAGGTLSDLRRFLTEPAFRSEFLATVREPEVVYYWQKVFPQLTGTRSVGPVLTRLQTFLSEKPMRLMVSQPENRLNFGEIMDTGKIFLAKLPVGLMGVEDAYLLGTLLVSKFQQLAMSRQAQAMSLRRDFWLYIDEFDHFITPSMAQILSGTRKYRLGLTLAHHDLHQLEQSPDVASAVLSHPATRIVFHVGDNDANRLAEGFAFFEARDLQNLGKGQAVCRVEGSDCDFNLSVPLPEKADETEAARRRAEIITASRKAYGTPRAEVEALLSRTLENGRQSPKPAKTETVCGEAQVPKPPPVPAAVSAPPPVETSRASAAEVPKTSDEARQPAASSPGADTMPAPEDTQHDAIKKRITAEAEVLDYTVKPEEFVAGSKKRIDLVLRRGTRTIACEISVTNTVEYEAATNITKCVNAGFGHVAAVCADRRKLAKIRERYAEMKPNAQTAKVGFYALDEFISKLFDWAAADPEGGALERGKPRKRKMNSEPLSEREIKERAERMLAELRQAMRR
jgi:hypothetical protein